jgi:hypothetical protein
MMASYGTISPTVFPAVFIWLRGRNDEVGALDSILLAIEQVRRPDGTFVPLRGIGAPPQRRDRPHSRTETT